MVTGWRVEALGYRMQMMGGTLKARRYVQIYTGEGKGKTTASLGLILRALGAGWRVLLVQFLKKGEFSEIRALKQLEGPLTILQFGSGRFVRGRPSEKDKKRALEGLAKAKGMMLSGQYDMVVLDEINVAMNLGLLPMEEVIAFMDKRPQDVEVVLTGRGAPDEILERADLVTECRKVRHYFDKGVRARCGIER